MDIEITSDPVPPPRRKSIKLKCENCNQEISVAKNGAKSVTIVKSSSPNLSQVSEEKFNENSKTTRPERPPLPQKSISFDLSQVNDEISSVNSLKPQNSYHPQPTKRSDLLKRSFTNILEKDETEEKPKPKPIPRPMSVFKPIPAPRKLFPDQIKSSIHDLQTTTLQEYSQLCDETDSSNNNVDKGNNAKKSIFKKKLGLKSNVKVSENELLDIHKSLKLNEKYVLKSFKTSSKCFSQYDLMLINFDNIDRRSKSLECIYHEASTVSHKPVYENCKLSELAFPQSKALKQKLNRYENVGINEIKKTDNQVASEFPSQFCSSNNNDENSSEDKLSSFVNKQMRPAAPIPYLGLRENIKQGFHKNLNKTRISTENFNVIQLSEYLYDSPKESQPEIARSENIYDSPRLNVDQHYNSPKLYLSKDEHESENMNQINQHASVAIERSNEYEEIILKTKDNDIPSVSMNAPPRPPPPRTLHLDHSLQESSPTKLLPKKAEPARPPPPKLSTDIKNENQKLLLSSPSPEIDSPQPSDKSLKLEDSDSSDSQSDNEVKYEKPPKRKLFFIAQEILTTERSFVNALKLICEDFREKIKDAIAKNNKFLPEGSYLSIFMNVEQIYELDKKFLQDLEERMEKWDQHNRIGDIIRSYSYFLKMYVTYIKGYDNAMLTLHDCLSTNLKFARYVTEFEEKNMNISSYFLRPIQRIPSYRLLLKEYLKNLPKDSVDFKDITDGVEIVSEVANHINESMKEGEKFQEVLRIQSMIVNLKDIVKPGRFLVKEGSLQKMSRKELQQRTFILFTDSLFYCSSVSQTLVKLILELPLTEMIVQYPESQDMTSEFSIISKKRSFYLKANSTKERDDWVSTLQNAIEIANRKMGTFTLKKDPPIMVMDLGDVAPPWIPDSRVTMCQSCTQVFNLYKRRHHCRACGNVVCSDCSSYEAPLKFMENEALRVCEACYSKLLERFNEMHRENKNEELRAKFKKMKVRKPKIDRRKTLPSTLTEIGAHEEGIQNSGFLKLVRKGQKDKRCWFVLKDHVLYKYKASSDPAAKTTTPILGYGVEVLGNWEEEDFLFALTHAGLKTSLVYRAENRMSAERWLHCLTKATELTSS